MLRSNDCLNSCFSWLQFIFSDRKVELLHPNNYINRQHIDAYLAPSLRDYAGQIRNRLKSRANYRALYMTSNLDEDMKSRHEARLNSVGRLQHWFFDYILIKDKDIFEHRGSDAFQYLLFQRYIIYFLSALTLVCMFILMPINVYGKNGNCLLVSVPFKTFLLTGENGYFEMTTINNINEKSNIFWMHTIIAIAMVILVGHFPLTHCPLLTP